MCYYCFKISALGSLLPLELPQMYRIAPSERLIDQALAVLVQQYSWKQVSIISEEYTQYLKVYTVTCHYTQC